jgi:hypothetical protein
MGKDYGYAKRDRSRATWHLVESKVSDRTITYCGLEMHEVDATGRRLLRSDDPPELCLSCQASA